MKQAQDKKGHTLPEAIFQHNSQSFPIRRKTT